MMLRKIALPAAALAALAALGCGYRTGYLVRGDISYVAVPVFANRTFYRHLEIGMTDAMVAEVERTTPYSISRASSADAVFQGVITSYTTPALTENATNDVTEQQVIIVVDFTLASADGRVLSRGTIREAETFSPAAGESDVSKRPLLFRRAARLLAEKAFERDW